MSRLYVVRGKATKAILSGGGSSCNVAISSIVVLQNGTEEAWNDRKHAKAYRLYDPVKKTIFKSCDVVFILEGSEKQSQVTGHSHQRVKTYVSLDQG